MKNWIDVLTYCWCCSFCCCLGKFTWHRPAKRNTQQCAGAPDTAPQRRVARTQLPHARQRLLDSSAQGELRGRSLPIGRRWPGGGAVGTGKTGKRNGGSASFSGGGLGARPGRPQHFWRRLFFIWSPSAREGASEARSWRRP